MRRLVVIVIIVINVLTVPSALSAQAECTGCAFGVYDDAELSRNFGFWDAVTEPVKSVWLGIAYDPTSGFQGLTGVELSVDGLAPFCVEPPCFSFDALIEPTFAIGPTIASPEDRVNGEGGLTIAWGQCLRQARALVRIDLVSPGPLSNDVVLRVTRKFPPSSAEVPYPSLTRCEMIFQRYVVEGGCYVINPTVGPGEAVNGCEVTETTAVASDTWSTIKRLYR